MTDSIGRERRICLAIVVVGILLFSVGTTYMNWVKYVSLRSTYAYDLGVFHNTAFNYAHGRTFAYGLIRAFFDTEDHEGPSVFRSNHFSPMRLLIIPQLYRPWPHIVTFFFWQSLIIGIGALPLFLFGTKWTGEPRLGLLLALSYLLHPAILHMAFNDFREIQLGVSFALFALWFHANRKPLLFVVAALLMLACRSEYVLLLALFGLINWRVVSPPKPSVRWVVAPLLLAALWAALTHAYYLYAYGQSWPLLSYALTRNPQGQGIIRLLERLPAFFRIALLPGVAGLLTPEALFATLPFVVGAKHLHWPAFPHHHLQHLSPALAVVFWAFACGVVRLWPWLRQRARRVAWAQGAILAALLASGVQFGWAAAQTYLVGGYPRYKELTRLNESLPADATVMVPKELMARFSNHTRLFTHQRMPLGTSSPLSFAEIRVIFEGLISVCDLVATEDGEEGVTALVAQSGRFLPVQWVGRYHLFVAKPDAPRPSDPDARLQQILRWDQMSPTKRRWTNIGAKE